MSVSETIKQVTVQEEFRICPVCGHDMGFNTSIKTNTTTQTVILICPECGARFDIGWQVKLVD